jgi:hypothetical protein
MRSLLNIIASIFSDADEELLQSQIAEACIPGLCLNCQPGGNHECTGKGLEVVYRDYRKGYSEEVTKLPCHCYRCRVLNEQPAQDSLWEAEPTAKAVSSCGDGCGNG